MFNLISIVHISNQIIVTSSYNGPERIEKPVIYSKQSPMVSIRQVIRLHVLLHLVAHHTHGMGFSVKHKFVLVTFLDLPRCIYR